MAKIELTRKDMELLAESLMVNGMRTRDELMPEDAVRKLELSSLVMNELGRDCEPWIWTLKVTGVEVKGDSHDGTDRLNRDDLQREDNTGEGTEG